MDNFLMMNEMFNLIMSGITLFGMKTFVGKTIDKYTINFLGVRRGEFASIAIYICSFYFVTNKLANIERNDINYLINAREMSGEIFVNTCLHFYPNKVNLELYRSIMLEKQQYSMQRMN